MADRQLTHAQMVAIIESGESVIHNGQIHSTVATLPLPEKVAQTPGEHEAVRRHLEGQIEAMTRRLTEMEAEHLRAQGRKSFAHPHPGEKSEAEDNGELAEDGYLKSHKALKEAAEAAGYVRPQGTPNPSRAALVEFLNAKKSGVSETRIAGNG